MVLDIRAEELTQPCRVVALVLASRITSGAAAAQLRVTGHASSGALTHEDTTGAA